MGSWFRPTFCHRWKTFDLKTYPTDRIQWNLREGTINFIKLSSIWQKSICFMRTMDYIYNQKLPPAGYDRKSTRKRIPASNNEHANIIDLMMGGNSMRQEKTHLGEGQEASFSFINHYWTWFEDICLWIRLKRNDSKREFDLLLVDLFTPAFSHLLFGGSSGLLRRISGGGSWKRGGQGGRPCEKAL